MTDTKFETLLKIYKTKSKELAREEKLVDLNLNALTWDEPKSYYEKLAEYCECANSIEQYLKNTYGLDSYQTLVILHGTKLEDVLSGKEKRSRDKESKLLVNEYWRRHKKLFEELGK